VAAGPRMATIKALGIGYSRLEPRGISRLKT